ncbi:hypothetical protein CXB51_018630 [Gossypium anomalum]|uniref:Uncharacterized protein n=1 Tax=Gossypium anomalum TaxID=47600 RepID=A0A8J6D147_9ROSI|nr:hypothetical protein CXB51_018630 [Gossypium anomalum]
MVAFQKSGNPEDLLVLRRREFYARKCCSFKKRDLTKHLKKMFQLFCALGLHPNLKPVILSSLPGPIQIAVNQALQQRNRDILQLTVGQIQQEVHLYHIAIQFSICDLIYFLTMVTLFPNFTMALADPNLLSALQVQIQIAVIFELDNSRAWFDDLNTSATNPKKNKKKSSRSSQSQFYKRWMEGDPSIGPLGEDNGKFVYLVDYSAEKPVPPAPEPQPCKPPPPPFQPLPKDPFPQELKWFLWYLTHLYHIAIQFSICDLIYFLTKAIRGNIEPEHQNFFTFISWFHPLPQWLEIIYQNCEQEKETCEMFMVIIFYKPQYFVHCGRAKQLGSFPSSWIHKLYHQEVHKDPTQYRELQKFLCQLNRTIPMEIWPPPDAEAQKTSSNNIPENFYYPWLSCSQFWWMISNHCGQRSH